MNNELELEKRLDLIRQYANHFICINGGLSTIESSLFGKKILIYEDSKYITTSSRNGYHLRGYSDDKEVYLFEKDKVINYVYPDVKPTSIITSKGEFDTEGNLIISSYENNRYFELQNFKKTLIALLKKEDENIDEELSIDDFGYSVEELQYIEENSKIIRDLFYSKEEQIKMEQETKKIFMEQMLELKELFGIDIIFEQPNQKSECEDKIIPFTKKREKNN